MKVLCPFLIIGGCLQLLEGSQMELLQSHDFQVPMSSVFSTVNPQCSSSRSCPVIVEPPLSVIEIPAWKSEEQETIRYARSDKLLGAGGVCHVYMGWLINEDLMDSIDSTAAVAIRVIKKLPRGTDWEMRRYRDQRADVSNEIYIHLQLKHKNILRLLHEYDDDNYYYIITEFVENGDLFKLVMPEGTGRGSNPLEEVLAKIYFAQIAKGVNYMHKRGFIHRDLKLENILLGNNFGIKIADFGFAVQTVKESVESVDICGTLVYIAPEVYRTFEYSFKTDVFAMGVLLYEMLTGKSPSSDTRMYFPSTIELRRSLNGLTSENAIDLIVNMLDVSPDTRYGIDQVLQHPWLTGGVGVSEESRDSPSSVRLRSVKTLPSRKGLN